MSEQIEPQATSIFRRWLREPFLHFALIGAAIFAISLWLNRGTEEEDVKRIVLTDDDLLQLVVTQRAQGLPDPSPEEFQRLVGAKVREEVLYREAVAMGLDQGDTIVKRRMAQKMDFLAEDLSTLMEPTQEQLETWLKDHPQDFAEPPRVTFRHLYFSFDKHGGQTRDAASAALEKAAGLPAESPEAAALGDRFMLKDRYSEKDPGQIAKEFGTVFAKSIFEQKPGAWTGPVESGYGWHLVFIDSITPGRVPAYEEVAAQVKMQWEAHQRAEFKAEAYRVMREKYEVVIPERPAEQEELVEK